MAGEAAEDARVRASIGAATAGRFSAASAAAAAARRGGSVAECSCAATSHRRSRATGRALGRLPPARRERLDLRRDRVARGAADAVEELLAGFDARGRRGRGGAGAVGRPGRRRGRGRSRRRTELRREVVGNRERVGLREREVGHAAVRADRLRIAQERGELVDPPLLLQVAERHERRRARHLVRERRLGVGGLRRLERPVARDAAVLVEERAPALGQARIDGDFGSRWR
jgi:hypothetical protein